LVWGVGQAITGPLSDRWGRKGLIVGGMWVQATGLLLTGLTGQFAWWFAASVLLGFGTAMVYPSLIAAVSDASHPNWRARSLSVYRFWRDLGFAIGALSAVLIADRFGFAAAILEIRPDFRIRSHRRGGHEGAVITKQRRRQLPEPGALGTPGPRDHQPQGGRRVERLSFMGPRG
jgi:MFS family permease